MQNPSASVSTGNKEETMTLIINNHDVEQLLTMEDTLAALEEAYLQLAAKEAVCRPRIDIRIPTSDPAKNYQWGTMEGGSTSGYFAIRMKSDIILFKCPSLAHAIGPLRPSIVRDMRLAARGVEFIAPDPTARRAVARRARVGFFCRRISDGCRNCRAVGGRRCELRRILPGPEPSWRLPRRVA